MGGSNGGERDRVGGSTGGERDRVGGSNGGERDRVGGSNGGERERERQVSVCASTRVRDVNDRVQRAMLNSDLLSLNRDHWVSHLLGPS